VTSAISEVPAADAEGAIAMTSPRAAAVAAPAASRRYRPRIDADSALNGVADRVVVVMWFPLVSDELLRAVPART
jgi:hypothetical protein